MNQIQDDKQRDQDQDNSHRKRGVLRRSVDTLGAVHDNLAVFRHIKRHGVLDGDMDAIRILSQIDDIDHILDNLTECQRNNGQIVASQP